MNASATTRQPWQPDSEGPATLPLRSRKALLGVCSLALSAMGLVAGQAAPQLATLSSNATNVLLLTNAAQVLQLSPEQAKDSRPVRLHGVVTCYDHGRVCFVQDETAGVFVYYTGDRLALHPGQGVELTGLTAPGRYSPIVASPSFQLLNAAPPAHPQPVSLAQIALGGLDAQWVEVTGIVRTEGVLDNRLCLELADPPHRVSVWIPAYEGYERQPLRGARVRVRGVVGIGVNARQEVEGFQLFANTLTDITLLQAPPADPFATPPWPMRALRAYAARRGFSGGVRVRGVVTLKSSHTLFLQDATGGVEVQTEAPLEEVNPGRTVEVTGFLGPLEDAPRLEDAVILKRQTNAVPRAAQPSPEELFQGLRNAELVVVEAQFLGWAESSSNRLTLALQAANRPLMALLEAPATKGTSPNLEPGCQVRLQGVCRSQGGPGNERHVALLLRSAADLSVISPPPTTAKPLVQVLAAATLLTGLGLAVALWLIQRQRRRTEKLLQLQGTLRTEMHQGEQQLRRSIEERERIARDLHDDIIQSIYAVGLNLEDCRRVATRAPDQVEAHLAWAIETLNKTIHSVRSFIVGLEPKVLNGREFKTALKSLALTSGEGSAQFQIEVDAAAANALASAQATQLLHIAKEAMSNSLRHAQASTIAVSLSPVPAGVRLEIRDDGTGFMPESPEYTGHGLRNLHARAREIGAELRIVSAPGEGCRIIAVVPQPHAHEPE